MAQSESPVQEDLIRRTRHRPLLSAPPSRARSAERSEGTLDGGANFPGRWRGRRQGRTPEANGAMKLGRKSVPCETASNTVSWGHGWGQFRRTAHPSKPTMSELPFRSRIRALRQRDPSSFLNSYTHPLYQFLIRGGIFGRSEQTLARWEQAPIRLFEACSIFWSVSHVTAGRRENGKKLFLPSRNGRIGGSCLGEVIDLNPGRVEGPAG